MRNELEGAGKFFLAKPISYELCDISFSYADFFSLPKWIIYKVQLVGSSSQLLEIYIYIESQLSCWKNVKFSTAL